MSTQVIQKDDFFQVGYINLPTVSLPALGVKRKSKLVGLAFNDRQKLKEAVDFLSSALKAWPPEFKDVKTRKRKRS